MAEATRNQAIIGSDLWHFNANNFVLPLVADIFAIFISFSNIPSLNNSNLESKPDAFRISDEIGNRLYAKLRAFTGWSS